ncbi:MAG: hypothetical protein L6257_01570 [Candidatus Portnoybacteria bacterium]|nr:hypothetical protein [Candidatus Portnoybacteria bacterium]
MSGTTTTACSASATHLISSTIYWWKFFLANFFSNRQAFYQLHLETILMSHK